jgi:hypothetical protein
MSVQACWAMPLGVGKRMQKVWGGLVDYRRRNEAAYELTLSL